MSNVTTIVRTGEVYTGYETATDLNYCTSSYFGCKACVSAKLNSDSSVTLSITLNTPITNYTKSFQVKNNQTFSWTPYDRFKVAVTIGNFSESNSNFSFDLTLELGVNAFGWHTTSFSHHFSQGSAPLLAAGISDYEFGALLATHALLDAGACNCH